MWISKQFSVNCQPTIKQLSGCTQSSNLMSFPFQRLFGDYAGTGGAALVISVAAVKRTVVVVLACWAVGQYGVESIFKLNFSVGFKVAVAAVDDVFAAFGTNKVTHYNLPFLMIVSSHQRGRCQSHSKGLET